MGGGFGGGWRGRGRPEVRERADRWAPPVSAREGERGQVNFGSRREERAGAGGNGPAAQEKEKGGKRKDKKEKGFSQGFNIALCLF
uniref:Uncharacterized protein n=1 Tax=Oryza sativa subsp. japonica TaxID=39947 RepID=Q6ZLF3_ORYSJ|nr:hypothetical protein [Oryza sativa Japonica Group]